MVQAGDFRRDLYYRLNIIPIRIPPLRERKEDIPVLAQHFLGQFNTKYAKNKKLTQGAMSLMIEYNWPGNIRELENLLERLVIIGNEPLSPPRRSTAFCWAAGKALRHARIPGPKPQGAHERL
jgi:transcriptional regulator with PAS, ATPase and Fis domain